MIETCSFGTDGIRGKVGTFPLTDDALGALGHAIGLWAQQKYVSATKPTILIGSDTRASVSILKDALLAGLQYSPLTLVDAGILPTPAILHLIGIYNYQCGIVISASHNPADDNGIKLLAAQIGKLSLDDEQVITQGFTQHYKKNVHAPIPFVDVDSVVDKAAQAEQDYHDAICTHFSPSFLSGIRVVLDCAHGATFKVAPTVFQSLGATIVATIGTDPNGTNINENCGSVHPEQLQQVVIEHKADIGFAFDGDGDRVILITKDGNIHNGDDILALLAITPPFNKSSKIVGTVMTNIGLEQHLKQNNKELIRTPVGDKYIAAKLAEDDLFLGGEASGHIIMRNHLPIGDGIFTALTCLQAMIATNKWDLQMYTKIPQIMLNIPVTAHKDLTHPLQAQVIEKHQQKLSANGRLVVRYSGTENVLRIMVEDTPHDQASALAHSLAQQLQQALSSDS